MDRNPCTLTALLDHWVCERGEQIALYFQDRKLTFRDLQQRSRTAAGVLSQLGIGPGSRVAFLDRNHISFFELMFGALYLGATLLPLNFRLAPTELLYVLTDSDAELLFVSADYLPIVLSLRAHIPRLQRVIVIDESEGSEYSQLFVDAPRLSPVSLHHAELDDVAVQMYTSGTTGQPKGALLTHRGLWAVVEQGLGWCPWQSGDVGMAPMPLFHIGGCGWSLVMLHAGLSVVLLRDPDPLSLMRAVQRFRVTQMFVVPVLLSAMVNHPQRADFDLRSLRHLFYGASPISAEVLASALANLSCGFVQVYGLTEATGTLTFLSAEDHLADRDRLRSCGRPGKDVTIRVIDAAGRDVPIGTVGEIIAKSLGGRGALIHTRDLAEACEVANGIAPEHLELAVADPESLLPGIRHAGAIFMGVYSSESLGDYCAGPNHVLPTARTARFSSPLGVYDFQKRSSVIRVSREGAATLGRIASELAHGEGLPAHARSAEFRLP